MITEAVHAAIEQSGLIAPEEAQRLETERVAAQIAEEAGFDRLGISDVIFWHDCYVLMGLISQHTDRIHLGPMVTNPYSRHPAVLAGIMAALQDASQGRMFLGIGVGAGLEQAGIAIALVDRPGTDHASVSPSRFIPVSIWIAAGPLQAAACSRVLITGVSSALTSASIESGVGPSST